MKLDWDHIKIFLAVARSGQILAAATTLRLDHATVSRRLNALEEQLQARLFERSPVGCVLTPAGEQLLPMAERVEADVLSIEAAVADSNLELSGTVKIGAADGFGTYFLAPMMGEMIRAHPALNLKLLPLPKDFSVSKREVDIAVTLQPPTDGRLICQRLIDYQLNLFVSDNYAKRDETLNELSDLRDHIVVTPILEFTYPTMDFFHEIAKQAQTTYECASVAAQLEAVLAGVGVGILPNYMAWRLPTLRLVLPHICYSRTYWLVSHPDGRDVARVATARRRIFDTVRAHREIFSTAIREPT
ncbi:LysR family transcriptional regulator [Rhodoligotrophos defluvii]|uniref:LysR family transcriptional regulator n=1 Tax=Rhodoligotrophos defluvii TaxID=2561934 RepID=UPI0010C9EEAF|nr:LysR family transcriptional regulator [Rhodoligotrophos defluvii]